MSDKSLLKKIKKLRRAIDALELQLEQDAHQAMIEAEQRGRQKIAQEFLSIINQACVSPWTFNELKQYLQNAIDGVKSYEGLDAAINTNYSRISSATLITVKHRPDCSAPSCPKCTDGLVENGSLPWCVHCGATGSVREATHE